MALLNNLLLLLLIPAATLLLILFSPAAAASTHDINHGFRLALTHVDSGKNLTKFQRLQRGIKRGNSRLHKLNSMTSLSLAASSSSDDDDDFSAPMVAGSGEFLMKLAIGTPPVSYSAIVDTGSDLIWTQCSPCTQCYKQPTPIFDPTNSSTFSKLPCSSDLCSALPQSSCGSDGCDYLYTYGDYSSTQGILATETFTFGNVKIPRVGFGCGEDNEGDGFTQGGGLVGLGRGPLSLVSQLKQPKFSYCLTSIDDATATSTLSMGSMAGGSVLGNASKTTSLIKNPGQGSFYYLALEGISVGGDRLPIKKSTFEVQDDGSGGIIIDSGTTITYLERSAYDEVKKAIKSGMNGMKVDESGSTGLDLCFELSSGSSGSIKVPTMVLHLGGGADLELPAENYMIADSSVGLVCLAMGGSSGMSILGNIQQQNLMVVYDLGKETLSFTPTQCDKL
ncbi:Aspartic proteinase nepenthesin-1 [Linum grandiflorum]